MKRPLRVWKGAGTARRRSPYARPRILVTNDDGVHGSGLRPLIAAMQRLGDVVAVVPDQERSADSHSLTLHKPIRVYRIADGLITVNGSPADCARFGVLRLMKGSADLVVSGINHGYNLGSDIFYSGTVAGAVEAALRGVPAIAISLERHAPADFQPAATFVRALAAEALARGADAIPNSSLLNVNLPRGAVTDYQITFLGRRVYRDQVDVRQDLRGRSYYWIGGPEENATDVAGSDCSVVRAGLASVTPLGLDLTHASLLRELSNWQVGSFVRSAFEHAR